MLENSYIEYPNTLYYRVVPKWNYDKSGVPVITDAAIEAFAYQGLRAYFPDRFSKPQETPIMEILEILKKKHKVNIGFADFSTQNGRTILGKVTFSANRILFNRDLLHESKRAIFRFTAAHEIGHWSLHRHRKIYDLGELDDDESDFDIRYGSRKLKTPRQWIEHQANVFAAALLMPESVFRDAVIQVQTNLGIRRNVGTVFVDKQAINITAYRQILSRLKTAFGTSESATRIRLEELGMLTNYRPQRVRRVGDILIEMNAVRSANKD